jgi:hypothetical protein
MGVYKLQIADFNTTEFELIAIHTTIEVSKLAFLLNKNLNTRFYFFDALEKTDKKEKGLFERYLFDDDENENFWNLLQNKSIIKGGNDQESLFNQFGQTMYLIPEFKKVDYILKVETDDCLLNINQIIQTILNISTISMSYTMDKNKIKTKSNLIF